MTRATIRRLIAENRKNFKDMSDWFTPEVIHMIKDPSDRKFITDVALPIYRSTGNEQRVRYGSFTVEDQQRVGRIIREANENIQRYLKE